MITLQTLRDLQSPAGTQLLAELANADLSDANTLRLLTNLRKRQPAELAAAALETARLRIKGRIKFGARADGMFFTRDALEQATDQRISRYRFYTGFFDKEFLAADLGCGIGGDSLALAEAGPLIGVDLDPLRLAMARANVPDKSALFIQADMRDPLPFSAQLGYVFFDPARRVDGRRIHSVKDYIPSLDLLAGWKRAIDVKLSPGVDLRELADYPNSQIEFISLEGDLKEAVLRLSGGIPYTPERKATLIDAAGNYVQLSRNFFYQKEPSVDVSTPRGVLYEPDPAVIRAGLVQDLAAQLGASLIDTTIAYLTADTFTPTPYARAWQILDWMPFNLKKLRAYLVERGVGRVTVKKRGSPLTPEELIAKLRLPGSGMERVVVLTHVQGNPVVIVCRSDLLS